MVTGNGMIAKRFSSYENNDAFLIYASGVSNSGTTDTDPYAREAALIKASIEQHPEKKFIYFSTCSVYDPSLADSVYVKHKLEMEAMIKSLSGNFVIFRLSNPVGKTNNRHTVLNFFIDHILHKTALTVWKNASRNILDIDDMFTITDHILSAGLFSNAVINVANPDNYSVPFIISVIEEHFKTKGIYHFDDKGNGPVIDISDIRPLLSQFNINFTTEYLPRLLAKYFPVS